MGRQAQHCQGQVHCLTAVKQRSKTCHCPFPTTSWQLAMLLLLQLLMLPKLVAGMLRLPAPLPSPLLLLQHTKRLTPPTCIMADTISCRCLRRKRG